MRSVPGAYEQENTSPTAKTWRWCSSIYHPLLCRAMAHINIRPIAKGHGADSGSSSATLEGSSPTKPPPGNFILSVYPKSLSLSKQFLKVQLPTCSGRAEGSHSPSCSRNLNETHLHHWHWVCMGLPRVKTSVLVFRCRAYPAAAMGTAPLDADCLGSGLTTGARRFSFTSPLAQALFL